MFKNIIIGILVFVLIIFWLRPEPEDTTDDERNGVTIEYKCDQINEYESVPAEVVEECRSRGFKINRA